MEAKTEKIGVNTKKKDGETALMLACRCYRQENRLELVKLLLENGADVNAKTSFGYTALMFAATDSRDNERVIRLLLENGADVNCQNKNGETALMYACISNGYNAIVDMLEYNADIELVSKEGFTALGFVCWKRDYPDIVRLLIEHGAKIDSGEYLPLFGACIHGHTKSVRVLLECGANVNKQSRGGVTALMCACKNGEVEAVKLLLKHGADVNISNEDGATALMYACARGDVYLMGLLIESGASVYAKTNNGITVFEIANNLYQSQKDEVLGFLAKYKTTDTHLRI